MKIPFKPSMLTIKRGAPRFIILHHTSEMYDRPESKIDNPKYQMPGLYKGVLEKKQGDVNYHYVVEKLKEDYIAVTMRPFVYLCEWPDINPSINNRAIHVGLMGNYDFAIPGKRMYEVLAYRLLNPLLKMFGLPPSRIKFHSEVSSNKELTCPGDFLDKEIIVSMVRRFVIK